MIHKARIMNFKCLRDVQVELERFTIFVGPNASGKSSILQGLDSLCRAFREPEVNIESELVQGMSRASQGQIELLCKSDERWYRYRTISSSTPPDSGPLQQGQRTEDGRAVSSNGETWKSWRPNANQFGALPLSILLRLETSRLVQPGVAAQDPAVMEADGSGLHSALAIMALNDPDAWRHLQDDLRRIIPTIRRLRHTRSAAVQTAALLFDTLGANDLLATQVSEGTILVLGLLAALHATGRPGLVLLDDLDRGLHPKAQKELIALLRELLKTNADLQIIATTHSPYMLDCMKTNEVRMTVLRDNGSTACAPLGSHPQFEKWKEEMSPGEMWSLFGEKWLAELEPSA